MRAVTVVAVCVLSGVVAAGLVAAWGLWGLPLAFANGVLLGFAAAHLTLAREMRDTRAEMFEYLFGRDGILREEPE